jgi:hypothetical protein
MVTLVSTGMAGVKADSGVEEVAWVNGCGARAPAQNGGSGIIFVS